MKIILKKYIYIKCIIRNNKKGRSQDASLLHFTSNIEGVWCWTVKEHSALQVLAERSNGAEEPGWTDFREAAVFFVGSKACLIPIIHLLDVACISCWPYLMAKFKPVVVGTPPGGLLNFHCTKNWIYKNLPRGKCGAKNWKLVGNERQRWYIPHLHGSLHGVVNSRANAAFTIFALDLTMVCTFFAPNL